MKRYTDAYLDVIKSQRINNVLGKNLAENFDDNYLAISILAGLGIARIRGKKMNTFWAFITKLLILYRANKSFEASASVNPNREDVYKLRQNEFPDELIYSIHLLLGDK